MSGRSAQCCRIRPYLDDSPDEAGFSLDWINGRMPSDEMRHVITLVAGLTRWPPHLDASELAERFSLFRNHATGIVQTCSGEMQWCGQSRLVAIWGREAATAAPELALERARQAASDLVARPVAGLRSAVILDAARAYVARPPPQSDRTTNADVTVPHLDTCLQLLTTMSPGEIAIRPAVDVLIAGLSPEPPLDGPEVPADRTATATHGDDFQPHIRAAIDRTADGNRDLANDIAHLVRSGVVSVESLPTLAHSTNPISVRLTHLFDQTGALKQFLRAASAFSNSITPAVLADALQIEEGRLDAAFAQACQARFLERVSDPATAGVPSRSQRSDRGRRYAFTCDLFRQVAYATFPARSRRTWHLTIANAAAAHPTPATGLPASEIAAHFAEGGDDAASVAWSQKAAQEAIERSASQAAIIHLQTAIRRAASTADEAATTLVLRNLYGPQLSAVRGNGSAEVLSIYERLLRNRPPDHTALHQHFDALWGMQSCRLVRGELDDARKTGAQLMACAQACGTSRHQILAHRMQGLLAFLLGNLEEATARYHQVLEAYDARRHAGLRHVYASDQSALAQVHLSWALSLAGNAAEAMRLSKSAIRRADELDHPHTTAHTLAVTAAMHLSRDDVASAAPFALAVRAIGQRHGFPYWSNWAAIMVAACDLPRNGMVAKAELGDAMDAYRRSGSRQILPFAFGLLARHDHQTGDMKAAQAAANSGLAEAARTGINVFTPPLQTTLAATDNPC